MLAALDTLLAGIDCQLARPCGASVPISDPDGQPVLDAAVAGSVDVNVIGEEALLPLCLDRPHILTARDVPDGVVAWAGAFGIFPCQGFGAVARRQSPPPAAAFNCVVGDADASG